MGVPVKLGSDGIEEVVELELTDEEQSALAASAEAVREVVGVLAFAWISASKAGRRSSAERPPAWASRSPRRLRTRVRT